MKGERSAQEREQARLDREAKRAAREGRPPPAALPPTEVPPGHPDGFADPGDPAPEPGPAAETAPVFEPAAEPVFEPAPEPVADPPVADDQDTQPDLEALPEPPLDEEFDPLPHGELDPPPPRPPPVVDAVSPSPAAPRRGFLGRGRKPEAPPRPSPPRRPPPYRPALAGAEGRGAGAADGLARPPEAADPGGGERRVGVARGIFLAVLLVLLVGAGWFAYSLFQPFKGEGSGTVRVAIARGERVGDIADALERRGVISSSFFFEARATIAGRRDDFKAGRFTLKKNMSNTAAMDAISTGPPPDVTQIAIPEGRARRQVAALVDGKLPGSYMAQTRKSKTLNPRSYGAPRSATLEGFLFPATYELKKGKRVSALVDEQLRLFKRNFAGIDLAAAKRRKLTRYDVLIIASMIDQEAQVERERPIIASVIYNRLREGIPLGIDATIRFATNNRTRPLTQSQLAIDSPYNTRTRRGLPPGPIGSPGLASIRAAAHPARTKYLFYVVKPGTCGRHAFSRTDAEFQRDVARYNNARAKRGGKSPTRC